MSALASLLLAAASAAYAAQPAAAAAPEGARLKQGRASFAVADVLVLADPTRSLDIDQVRALEEGKDGGGWSRRKDLNFGFSSSRYWLKFQVVNEDARNSEWALEFGYPMIQDLRFYEFQDGKLTAERRLGRLQPFWARPVDHWNFIFDFALPAGRRTDMYVMIQSVGHMDAAMTVYTHDALLSKTLRKAMGMGLYCGIILAMVLYNLFLFVSIRDRTYFYYIVYALMLCLLQSTLNGTTYQFLWPGWVSWNNVSAPVFCGLSYLFLGLFTKSLLDTRRLVPRLHHAITLVMAAAAFLIVWALFFYGLNTNRFTSLLQIFAPVVLLPVAAACAWEGSRVAVYYALAFGLFFLGSSTLAAGFIGWAPRNFLTVNSMYFGSAAETVLLSLALAARIKVLKEDKLRADLESAESARKLSESQERLERQLAVSELASQVAHDIRSPLAALDVVERDLSQLSESTRILIRSAVGRIRDIANGLVETNKEIQAAIDEAAGRRPPAAAHGAASVELVSSHIDPLMTEKRLQFRGRIAVEISAALGPQSYGLFARIVPADFKRDLSNLVNNAVEAVGERGRVRVELASEGGEVAIKIRDDGKGIEAALLPRLGRRGETHGKPGGLGLGIYQAKRDAESWGGRLEIESAPGKGTTVSLRLPKAPPPPWFVPSLTLRPGSPVAVLDDDPSIHQIWQGRFDALGVKERGIEALHFSSPESLRAWVRAHGQAARAALYLADQELVGYSETGLSLIEELGLGARAILVTSHAEEKSVLADCARLGVRLIPKTLAPLVPLEVEDSGGRRGPDAVLLDDDALVHATWRLAAKAKGVELAAFSTPQDLLQASGGFAKGTPIYLDAELGGGARGERVAQELHALGFSDLYLATGRDAAEFPDAPWIKKVVGKEPPWS